MEKFTVAGSQRARVTLLLKILGGRPGTSSASGVHTQLNENSESLKQDCVLWMGGN